MSQKNSFDSLRLIGSIIVLLGHSFLITAASPPMIGNIPIHSFGVVIFFTISGFLITQSWMSDNDVRRYLIRRGLRIFPALLVVLTVTALVIGPWATTETLHHYFRHGSVYRYIISNALLVTYWSLPATFQNLPLSEQANGSLWTIPIEFCLYLLVPFLVMIHRRVGGWAAAAILLAALAVVVANSAFPSFFQTNVMGVNIGWGLSLAPYFWIGCALRLLDLGMWPERSKRLAFVVSLPIALLWAVLASRIPHLIVIAIIPIASTVLLLGMTSWLHSSLMKRVGDLSYGVYLWAFPIQQLVMEKTTSGPIVNLAIAVPVTLVLAYASWHLIERPALRFKPRRRVRPAEEHSPAVSEAALQSPI